MIWRLLSLSGCISAVVFGVMGSEDLVVETTKGKVSGLMQTSRDGRQYLAWRKIPYAKPPVGKRRLAAPEPMDPWSGILPVAQLPPACLQQAPWPLQPIMSEDCLYLGVYKPKIAKDNLPVLAYIHGGSFSLGYSAPVGAPDYIMDEDVVLVPINYRLGPFGFMSLNHTAFPGNYGLKDQALGLKWIKQNIKSFGGNPNSITVFGESAGGISTCLHMVSPLSKNLVNRGMAMSGCVPQHIWRKTPNLIVTGNRKFADDLGCKQSDPVQVLQCLRAIPNPQIFLLAYGIGMLKSHEIIIPVVEPDHPGAFIPPNLHKEPFTKPMILSFTAGEHIFFESLLRVVPLPITKVALGEVEPMFKAVLDDLRNPKITTAAAWEKIKSEYLSHLDDADRSVHDLCMLMEDLAFLWGTLSVAEKHQGPRWVYHLDHRGEFTTAVLDGLTQVNDKLPTHADDLLYLFNLRKALLILKKQNPEDLRVSKELIKYLVNFAYSNNPTPQGSKYSWKPYKGNEILRIRTGSSVMADPEFVRQRKDIRNFWSGIIGGPTN